jgi:hypothetical protein
MLLAPLPAPAPAHPTPAHTHPTPGPGRWAARCSSTLVARRPTWCRPRSTLQRRWWGWWRSTCQASGTTPCTRAGRWARAAACTRAGGLLRSQVQRLLLAWGRQQRRRLRRQHGHTQRHVPLAPLASLRPRRLIARSPAPAPAGLRRCCTLAASTASSTHTTQVFLYKRAQIFVGDVYGAFKGLGLGRFDDIDKITMFADYRCAGVRPIRQEHLWPPPPPPAAAAQRPPCAGSAHPPTLARVGPELCPVWQNPSPARGIGGPWQHPVHDAEALLRLRQAQSLWYRQGNHPLPTPPLPSPPSSPKSPCHTCSPPPHSSNGGRAASFTLPAAAGCLWCCG